jgi:hypothetical protein
MAKFNMKATFEDGTVEYKTITAKSLYLAGYKYINSLTDKGFFVESVELIKE